MTTTPTNVLASVDLGSNSFRLQVCENNNGQLKVIDSFKQMVRFAAGLDEHKNLDEASQERALDCLAKFGERLRGFKPEQVRVVATNTFRVAKNIAQFLPKAEAALGFPIEIIAGREEARLIYTGVVHTLPPNGDKMLVIDIGGGTTDIAVYTNGAIRHTAVIPVAGDLITKDLAQALRTPHSAAEYIKIHYGVAIPDMDGLDEMVEVPSVGDRQPRQISRRVLASVIGPRVEEILELTLNELRRSGFPEEVLTSGIVLTGGASMLTGIVELAEEVFGLPARIGVPQEMGGVSERIRNPRYSTAIGLLQAARGEEDGAPVTGAIVVHDQAEKISLWARLMKFVKDNF